MKWPIVGALVGALLSPASAQASGFATSRFTAQHGHPLTTNPTASYFNPAALRAGRGVRLLADLNLALRTVNYERTNPTVQPEDAVGINAGETELRTPAIAGIFAGAAEFNDLTVGLGVFIPFGGTADWPDNDAFAGNNQYPGGVDGVQRFHSIAGRIGALYLTLALAYEIGDTGLSIGLSGNLIRSTAELVRAQTATFDDNPANEGRIHIKADGFSGSFGVGVMYEALEDVLWFGASYQAPPGMYRDMEMSGTIDSYLAGTGSRNDVVLYQQLPDVLSAGVRLRVRRDIELRLFGDFTRWSVFKDQCLALKSDVDAGDAVGEPCSLNEDGSVVDGTPQPVSVSQRRFKNTGTVRAGVSYWLPSGLELFGGIGWDGNAVEDGTLDPALYDADDLEVSLGTRFQIGEHVAWAISYTHLQYLPRDTQGKGRLDQFQPPSRQPSAEGKFTSWIGILNTNIEASF